MNMLSSIFLLFSNGNKASSLVVNPVIYFVGCNLCAKMVQFLVLVQLCFCMCYFEQHLNTNKYIKCINSSDFVILIL